MPSLQQLAFELDFHHLADHDHTGTYITVRSKQQLEEQYQEEQYQDQKRYYKHGNQTPNVHKADDGEQQWCSTCAVDQVKNIAADKSTVVGGRLAIFSKDPPTGFFLDGFCRTGPEDNGIAATMTSEFLDFTVSSHSNVLIPHMLIVFRASGLKGQQLKRSRCQTWSEMVSPRIQMARGDEGCTRGTLAERSSSKS